MACSVCNPELNPTTPRRTGLFGTRFGDAALRVFRDGEEVLDCYEVDVVAGKAWRFERPLRECECRKSVAAYVDHGKFSVVEAAGLWKWLT